MALLAGVTNIGRLFELRAGFINDVILLIVISEPISLATRVRCLRTSREIVQASLPSAAAMAWKVAAFCNIISRMFRSS